MTAQRSRDDVHSGQHDRRTRGYGRNDLDGAIRRTVDAGANFYTLASRPHNTDWKGQVQKDHG